MMYCSVINYPLKRVKLVLTQLFTSGQQSGEIITAHIRSMMRRLCFQRFCPSVHRGGGGVKIEKCSECHGKPKKCIKICLDYTPFDQVGGGGGERGGVLSSNFVHQMCHQGGGGGSSGRQSWNPPLPPPPPWWHIWWTKLELRNPPSLPPPTWSNSNCLLVADSL